VSDEDRDDGRGRGSQRGLTGGVEPVDDLMLAGGAIEVVTFTANPDPSRKDPIGRHPVDGRIVFPDRKRGGEAIKPGRTYFCSLDEYRPPSGSPIYYAVPVQQVDAAFLFDLRSDQVSAVVDALESSAHGQLVDQARAEIKRRVEASLRGELEAARADRDGARADLEDLRATITGLREERGTMELEARSLRQRVAELEAEGARGAEGGSSTVPEAVPWAAWAPPAWEAQVVVRSAEEQLESPLLRDGLYFVHVSPDRGVLRACAHPEGNLPAVGGRLTVPGLGMLRAFEGREEMRARVEPRTGAVLVHLAG
jgi:hypothetical protein